MEWSGFNRTAAMNSRRDAMNWILGFLLSPIFWAHLTFFEPAFWLGCREDNDSKCSPEEGRFPKNPLDKSKTRPAKRPGKQAD